MISRMNACFIFRPFPAPLGADLSETWELLLEYYIKLLEKNQVVLLRFGYQI
jgi:hypothetical protein